MRQQRLIYDLDGPAVVGNPDRAIRRPIDEHSVFIGSASGRFNRPRQPEKSDYEVVNGSTISSACA
jgi:hypothetical protein